MTLQEVLFKPFVPPPVACSRKYLADGYEEPEKYRPKGSIAKAIDARRERSNEVDKRVLEYIRRHPATTRNEISKALQLKQSRTAERMNQLETRGLVVSESRCLSNHGGAKTIFYWVSNRGH